MSNSKMPGGSLKSGASLRIFGRGLDLIGISKALGVEPTSARPAGTPMPSGEPMPRDLWLLTSPLPRDEPIDTHIVWLRQTLESRGGFLCSLKEMAEIRTFCGVIINGEQCSFTLSVEALRLFLQLSVDLELSLIFVGYSDEQAAPREPPESELLPGTYRTECRVFLDLCGDKLDPAQVSQALGAEAIEFHRAGELDDSGKPYRTNLLCLAVAVDPKEEVNTHLNRLASFLSFHSDFVRSLDSNVMALVRCEFGTESDSGGLGISPEVLRVPVGLGLSLQFNVRLI